MGDNGGMVLSNRGVLGFPDMGVYLRDWQRKDTLELGGLEARMRRTGIVGESGLR